MRLTIAEIRELAGFCGLVVAPMVTPPDHPDDEEAEVEITECPKDGVMGDDKVRRHYAHVAYFVEYPEEGCCPLGAELPNTNIRQTDFHNTVPKKEG